MPKFGWCKFAEDKFGIHVRYHNLKFRMAGTVPVGESVRRTIGKGPKCTGGAVTHRVRRGNGYYGSIASKIYQDKYNYSAAMKAIDNAPAPYQRNYAVAIDYWQNILTASQKKEYDKRAGRQLRMSGYNLFLREALTGVYHMYVDRGDPASYDFAKEALLLDGAWHDLDLSSIVPKTARAVFIIGHVEGNGIDWKIMFRKNGNTNEINHGGMETLRANVERHRSSIVAIGNDQIIEYKADNENWATLDLAVRGWWT